MSGDTNAPALRVHELCKTFRTGLFRKRERVALKNVSLEAPRGAVFGYLGPNGSGKTTTLKILIGLLRADAGELSVLGLPHSRPEWRARIGYLPEHPYFYDYLTAYEYLDYAGRLLGLAAETRRERARELLGKVGLGRSGDVALRKFSKGMVQRVGIAQALLNDPELVFLDEPMSGLDPLGRRLVRDLILGLREKGRTVFFSTHILSDAESLCDRVAVLRGGELLRVGRLVDILALEVSHLEVLVSGLGETALEGVSGITSRRAVGERTRLEIAEQVLGSVVQAVEQAGGHIVSVLPVRQSLEDYFVNEMNEAREGGWIPED